MLDAPLRSTQAQPLFLPELRSQVVRPELSPARRQIHCQLRATR
jgi:hypothetical protein